MKRLLTTLVFVLTASLIVQAEDLLKYLRDTQDWQELANMKKPRAICGSIITCLSMSLP